MAAAGSVGKITYLDNGTTTMIYEPHDYYDPTAGTVVQGGGGRIKQIIDYDGINVAHNMVSNYSYANPSTGITSGKPTSLPVYGFTRPYTGSGSSLDLWKNATVRSELDLSPNDHSIVYSHVKEAKNGAGNMVYEYYTPATNYDTSAFPSCFDCTTSDWAPTITFIARPGCGTAGFMTNDKSTYPFAPTTNYDFERGLVKSVKVYNEVGGIVDETEYLYQRVGMPISITGLRWDENAGFKVYSKYTVLTSTGELTKKVVKKTTDLPPYSQVKQTSSSYFYDSPFHHLSTRQEVTNSDGTIKKAFVKYVKDYNTGTINDVEVNAIHQLKLQNQNIPIEQYRQVQKPNNDLKVTSGSLLKFKAFNFGSYSLYMPSQKLGFVSQNGITGFTTSSISSGIFTYDSNYIPLENYLIYDSSGFLQTKDDNHKQVQTSLSSSVHHFPVANISNAAADEIAYYNPNNMVTNSFFNIGNGITGPYAGRAGLGSGSSGLEPGISFSKAIKKNKNAKNYIFSVWLNSYESGTFSITLTGTDNVPHVYPLNFTANSGTWKYYEIKVPVVNLSPTFNIDIQHNTTSVLFLTDVLFYPENSEITTSDYRVATLSKIVQTNTNGISEYYESDNLGRLSLVYDQDKQIKARTSYLYQDTYQTFSDPTFSFSPVNNIIAGTDVRFYNATNYNPCQFTGITFSWDFGDGSAPLVTSSTISLDHRYAVAGTYNVTLTVSALGQSNKTTKAVVVVVPPPVEPPPPLVIPIVYVNNSSGVITSIQLSQNGVVKYTFTGDELDGGVMVPAQSYRVRVFCSGSYGSVNLNDGDLNYCSEYGGGNSYTFFANLVKPRSLTITISDGNCN
ncbi:PKD domain-containing protein [Pedobacter hiemivivus]|uniref:PKD domain-containing protein n=2 Tax=Pedobacter hiemivivus TaxID=2530454 RepID=A0A4U1G984_9SPHI|nr:PKD domain-containing protein [Pedobacter hiemivivus]